MTPSEQAKLAQLKDANYPGIDNWQDCNLHSGNIVYIWEADGQSGHFGGNAYSMSPETALGCNGDPNQLQDALQTNLPPEYDSHRGHLQAYRINEETPAAFSHCEANVCHGTGGGEQYFIPNFDERLKDGRIEKVDALNLDFNRNTLLISPDRIISDQMSTQLQQPETTATPSRGTTPTLEGAYTGPSPDKEAELKPLVDEAQSQWNSTGTSSDNSVAGTLPPTTNTPRQPGVEAAGTPPENVPRHPENQSTPAGTLPENKQNIELSSKKSDGLDGASLAKDTAKQSGVSFDPSNGIT